MHTLMYQKQQDLIPFRVFAERHDWKWLKLTQEEKNFWKKKAERIRGTDFL